MLHEFTFRSALPTVLDAATPAGKFFYSPLGWAHCRSVYALFGLQPIGFHVCTILLLVLSALLLVFIAGKLTGDERVAWGSGYRPE